MHIHLLQATQKRTLRSSKDTNGGYGTVNDFGRGLTAFLLKYVKRGTMNFPELLPAYAQAILRTQGHTVTYAHNQLDARAEIVAAGTLPGEPAAGTSGRSRSFVVAVDDDGTTVTRVVPEDFVGRWSFPYPVELTATPFALELT